MTYHERPSGAFLARSLVLAFLLAVLVLPSFAPPSTSPPMRSAAPASSRSLAPASAPPATLAAPIQPCAGGNSGFYAELSLAYPSTNASWNASSWTVGPAPLATSFHVLVSGAAITYNASVAWGDGSLGVASFVKSIAGDQNFTLNHTFSLPAVYSVVVWVNYTCSAGPGYNATNGWTARNGQLTVYGSGGPTPIAITVNITSAPVPASVFYNASVAGAPTGAWAVWRLYSPFPRLLQSGPLLPWNGSTFAAQLNQSGTWYGTLLIYYPNHILLFAQASTPVVNVTPLAWVAISYSPFLGLPPWNVTFSQIPTNLSGGGPYGGSYTPTWTFFDSSPGDPDLWAYGPAVGNSVWRVYDLNVSWAVMVGASVSLVRPDGVPIAQNTTWFYLPNVNPPNPVSASLTVTPNNGTAPLLFNLTVSATGLNLSKGPVFFVGSIDTWAGANVWRFNSSTNVTWGYFARNWTGAPFSFPYYLRVAGDYRVDVGIVQDVSNAWTYLANVNTSIFVRPGSPGSTPVLSFAAAPSNGPAPLNVTAIFLASGGSAPYNLSVCAEGPYALPNMSVPCPGPATASWSGWNGSAVTLLLSWNASGNYTILASLVDSAGATSNATAAVVVGAPAPVPPLAAHASYLAPSAVSEEGARYGFVTTVSGGVAPYNVQWTFGDGSSGSSLPGSIVAHTYTASGTYNVVLRVTDARGSVAVATIGPLLVSVPLAGPSPVPWWASGVVLVATVAVALASSALLASTWVRLRRRKEALNWFRDMQAPREPGGPPTGPR